MNRTVASIAGGLAATLLLVPASAAQAAVTAKDAPSKGDIVKAFPELADGEFNTAKTKKIGAPGKTCEKPATQKVKSAVATTGVSATGQPIVVAGVAELKSAALSKAYLAKYKKYVKKCASYTDPTTGATVTMSLTKAPKLGESSLAIMQQVSLGEVTTHSSTVLIRNGKRIGSVVTLDDAPASKSSVNKLAKVTAKKMK